MLCGQTPASSQTVTSGASISNRSSGVAENQPCRRPPIDQIAVAYVEPAIITGIRFPDRELTSFCLSQVVPLIISMAEWYERLATGFRFGFPKPDSLPPADLVAHETQAFQHDLTGCAPGKRIRGTGTQSQRNSRSVSRDWIDRNSIATPSTKWRTTRPRILPSRTAVPIEGRISTSTAAPDSDRSMIRQV